MNRNVEKRHFGFSSSHFWSYDKCLPAVISHSVSQWSRPLRCQSQPINFVTEGSWGLRGFSCIEVAKIWPNTIKNISCVNYQVIKSPLTLNIDLIKFRGYTQNHFYWSCMLIHKRDLTPVCSSSGEKHEHSATARTTKLNRYVKRNKWL